MSKREDHVEGTGMPPLRQDSDEARDPRGSDQPEPPDSPYSSANVTDLTGNVFSNRRADDKSRLRFSDEHGAPVGRDDRSQGVQPPDDEIEQDVRRSLAGDTEVDATSVTVTVSAGEVTLTGTVADHQARMAAEDCVAERQGVRRVHNHLQVDRAERQEPPKVPGGSTPD